MPDVVRRVLIAAVICAVAIVHEHAPPPRDQDWTTRISLLVVLVASVVAVLLLAGL